MYKMIFGAKRKPGMPMDEFKAYWLGPHADKARKVPGIHRYVINLLADLGGSGRELPYDGFAETWFLNEDDMRRSGRSDELKVVLADEVNLFDLSTRWSVIVQENLMIDAGEPVGYAGRG
jgi:uncharacterized protein (TIGR02118 family)